MKTLVGLWKITRVNVKVSAEESLVIMNRSSINLLP